MFDRAGQSREVSTDTPEELTAETFCRQAPPRTIPSNLIRPDPWLLGGVAILTIIVLWVTFEVLRGADHQAFVLVTYALFVFLFFLIGRRSGRRFRDLLRNGVAVQGVVKERGTKSRELPKSTITFYYVEIEFPGGELGPVKQTVPEADWHRLKESSSVSVLRDPSGENGYLLVDILKLS